MNKKRNLRIINGIFWLWMWLSSAMLPVTANTDKFWSAKLAQLFILNPNIDDIFRLLGNALIPFILWGIIDRFIKRLVN
jgi:hypothetical protein